MARVKRGVTTHARHKKVIEQAKGYRGRAKNVFRVAIERVERGAVLVAKTHRRPIQLRFRGVFDISDLEPARFEPISDASIEVHEIGRIKYIVERQHGKVVVDFAEFPNRGDPDALGWRVRRNELRVFGLQRLNAAHETIVFSVRNERIIQNVVREIVALYGVTKRSELLSNA